MWHTFTFSMLRRNHDGRLKHQIRFFILLVAVFSSVGTVSTRRRLMSLLSTGSGHLINLSR